jgi:hypothetical protein
LTNQLATPDQPDIHQQIAGSIEAAAATLPAAALTVDRDFEGQLRINGSNINTGGGYVQLSKDGSQADAALGYAEIGGSVKQAHTLGAYSFRSTEGQGVNGAAVRRMVTYNAAHDGITRAGAQNHQSRRDGAAMMYEHKFGPGTRDKVGKLATDMVISRAKRRGEAMEELRKAA